MGKEPKIDFTLTSKKGNKFLQGGKKTSETWGEMEAPISRHPSKPMEMFGH